MRLQPLSTPSQGIGKRGTVAASCISELSCAHGFLGYNDCFIGA